MPGCPRLEELYTPFHFHQEEARTARSDAQNCWLRRNRVHHWTGDGAHKLRRGQSVSPVKERSMSITPGKQKVRFKKKVMRSEVGSTAVFFCIREPDLESITRSEREGDRFSPGLQPYP